MEQDDKELLGIQYLQENEVELISTYCVSSKFQIINIRKFSCQFLLIKIMDPKSKNINILHKIIFHAV